MDRKVGGRSFDRINDGRSGQGNTKDELTHSSDAVTSSIAAHHPFDVGAESIFRLCIRRHFIVPLRPLLGRHGAPLKALSPQGFLLALRTELENMRGSAQQPEPFQQDILAVPRSEVP